MQVRTTSCNKTLGLNINENINLVQAPCYVQTMKHSSFVPSLYKA